MIANIFFANEVFFIYL